MANAMQPMSSVSMRPLRTQGSGDLATVWFEGSWVSGPPDTGSVVNVRGMILWQRGADARWRVALEHIA
jgi:ketosteroid isomerase-like protein